MAAAPAPSREVQQLNLSAWAEDNVIFTPKKPRALPVTIVTGFLGAGKTTLIQHLTKPSTRLNLRIAVCVHEAAEVNIDQHFLRTQESGAQQGSANKGSWVVPLLGGHGDGEAHVQCVSGAHVPSASGTPHHELRGAADVRRGPADVARHGDERALLQRVPA